MSSHRLPTKHDPALDFVPAGSINGEAIRSFDWARTSLGDPAHWPASLKTMVQVVLHSGQPMCFWWGRDLLQFQNDAYLPMLGERRDAALGAPFRSFWAEVWDDVRPFVDDAFAGKSTRKEDLPLRMTRNGVAEDTYWTFSYSPIHGDDGEIAGLLNIVTETTNSVRDRLALDRANAALLRANESLAAEFTKAQDALGAQREAEKRQRVLQRELSHRMKNTLSMVQAVVTQSLRHASDMKDAAERASARIQALGRAQDTLTATDWQVSNVAAVVGEAIAPHRDDRGDRFVIEGPAVELAPQQAMGLALAIHELATNATKYGALSNAAGMVTISWSIPSRDRFRFSWREEGGPSVEVPTRRGFGSQLTQRVVPGYFDGTATLDYAPTGFRYTLDGSLAAALRETS